MTKFTDEITGYSKQDPQIARFVTEIQKFTAATNKVCMYTTSTNTSNSFDMATFATSWAIFGILPPQGIQCISIKH